MNTNDLINSIPYMKRQLDERSYTSASLHDREYKKILGDNFVNFFLNNSYGKTSSYRWEVIRVDELINLKIWKI